MLIKKKRYKKISGSLGSWIQQDELNEILDRRQKQGGIMFCHFDKIHNKIRLVQYTIIDRQGKKIENTKMLS